MTLRHPPAEDSGIEQPNDLEPSTENIEDTPINGRMVTFGIVVVLLILAWLWLTFRANSDNASLVGSDAVIEESAVTLTPTNALIAAMEAAQAREEATPTLSMTTTSIIPTEIGTARPTNTFTPTVTSTPTVTFTPSATVDATETPLPSPTSEPSATPTASETPTASATPEVSTTEIIIIVTATPDETLQSATPTVSPTLAPSTATPTPPASSPPLAATTTGYAIASPVNGEALQPGDVVIAGVAPPGEQVQVLDNGEIIAAITVNAQGQWRYTYQPTPGPHRFQVRPVNQPSLASPVIEVTVLEPIVAPAARCTPGMQSGDVYIVGTCESLANISAATGTSILDLVETNPNINPDLIFPGQVIQLPE